MLHPLTGLLSARFLVLPNAPRSARQCGLRYGFAFCAQEHSLESSEIQWCDGVELQLARRAISKRRATQKSAKHWP